MQFKEVKHIYSHGQKILRIYHGTVKIWECEPDIISNLFADTDTKSLKPADTIRFSALRLNPTDE